MKKVMLVCAAATLLWQCSKEDELGKVPDAPEQESIVKAKIGDYNYLEEYPAPADPEATVTSFLQDYNNSNLEAMALDEAIWHLEAAVNFENRHDVYTFVEYDVDTIDMVVDVSNGTISGADLESAYQKVALSVNEPSGLSYQVSDITVSDLTDTKITIVVLNYYVKTLTGFTTNGADRWAGANKNCQQPPQSTNLAGFDYAALIAYNKYLNQSGNTPGTRFLWYYSLRLYSSTTKGNIAINELFGGKDAPFSNHQWTSNGSFPVYPAYNICVYASEMSTYRDQIHSQVTGLGNPSILDIEWSHENTGIPQYQVPRRGRWIYKRVLVGVAQLTEHGGG